MFSRGDGRSAMAEGDSARVKASEANGEAKALVHRAKTDAEIAAHKAESVRKIREEEEEEELRRKVRND